MKNTARLFRLYTENVNRDRLEEECSDLFTSFTLLEGTGYFKGKEEACLIVEVLTPAEKSLDIARHMVSLAHSIKHFNNQQEVLLLSHDVASLSI